MPLKFLNMRRCGPGNQSRRLGKMLYSWGSDRVGGVGGVAGAKQVGQVVREQISSTAKFRRDWRGRGDRGGARCLQGATVEGDGPDCNWVGAG